MNTELNNGPDARQAPRISVVIPAYNVARFIPDTLESVFAQTLPAIEVIVVNDGSPDTPELELALAPFSDRIRYLPQANTGPSGARNRGIDAANGEFIATLDGDDIWLPTYLEAQSAFLESHPEFGLVYCNAIFFGDSVYTGQEYMDVCPSQGEATATALISRRCHVFTSVLARAEVLKAVPYEESLRYSEDYDCWLRIVAAGHRIGYHREVLVRYRKHNESLSADVARMGESNLRVLNRALELWPEGSEENRLLLQARAKKTAELATFRGKLALHKGDVEGAAAQLADANLYFQSPKIRGILVLLRFAPGAVRFLIRLRSLVLPHYRERTT